MRQLAKMGGNRADAGQEGGNRPSVSEADDNNAAPRDNGGASTPQWLFDRCNLLAIEACGEPISLDVAAAEWNHKCERYFTEETDALTQEWDANAVFCNRPFSATIIEPLSARPWSLPSMGRRACSSFRGGTILTSTFASGMDVFTAFVALAALGVKDIIICGHSHCGAMQGLLQPEQVASLPAVSSWLSHAETTRRIIRDNYGHLDGDRLLTAAVEENVLVQLENLRTHPAVGSRLVRGDLHLHGWVYKIETGEVFAYDVGNGTVRETDRVPPAH